MKMPFITGTHIDYLAYELALRGEKPMLNDERQVAQVDDLFNIANLISEAKEHLRKALTTESKREIMRELTVLHEELFLTVQRLKGE